MTAPRNATEVTQERLHALFYYDPEVGTFHRRKGNSGRPVGTVCSGGYIRLTLDDCKYRAHRLAWLYVHGRWPAADLDHVNGNRADNRIANLRECTRAENAQNQIKRTKPTSSNYLGVSRCKLTGRWAAQVNRRKLGRFDTPELAYAAYLAAKAELHTFNPVPRRQHEQRSAH